MSPRRLTQEVVSAALSRYPDGVTSSVLSADLKCPPATARAALHRLAQAGGCARIDQRFRPLTEHEVRAQILALLTSNPGNEYGHRGVREALPHLHLTAGQAEAHLAALHATGQATHAHDPTDDPWHWYGAVQ